MKVLKFGASWCAGCLVMRPRWQELEAENDWLETEYFDCDEYPEKLEEYNVGKDIPVFIFLDKENNEIFRLVGEISKKEIQENLDKYKNK